MACPEAGRQLKPPEPVTSVCLEVGLWRAGAVVGLGGGGRLGGGSLRPVGPLQ